MKIYILDGIGTYNRPDGIVLTQVADAIKAKVDISEVRWINWPASMMGQGGKLSWNDASRVGVNLLTEAVQSNDEDFILLAFSGGNKPAKQWLEENPELRKRCKAVGLVSDPFRPRDKWQNGVGNPGGWGISGEDYGPVPEMTFWTSNPGDMISSARDDAIVRTFADGSEGPPDMLIPTITEKLKQNKLQLGYQLKIPFVQWFTSLGRRITEGIGDVQRYMSGWHTTRYTTSFDGGPSLSSRIGASIAWRINNPK